MGGGGSGNAAPYQISRGEMSGEGGQLSWGKCRGLVKLYFYRTYISYGYVL